MVPDGAVLPNFAATRPRMWALPGFRRKRPPACQDGSVQSGLAIASLIFGIPFLFFPFSIVAVVFGHVSLSQIKKSAGRLGARVWRLPGWCSGILGSHDSAHPDHRGDCDPEPAAGADGGERFFRSVFAWQHQQGNESSTNFGEKIGYATDLQSLAGPRPLLQSLAVASSLPGRNGYISPNFAPLLPFLFYPPPFFPQGKG